MEFDVIGNVVRYRIPIGNELHEIFALTLPEMLPPSFNELILGNREFKANARRKFQYALSKVCSAAPIAYQEKRTVRIDLFKKSQQDDACNLDGRSKVPLDSMKQLGFIVDDNQRWLDWARVWQRKHPVNSTVILMSSTMDARLMMECHELAPHALRIVTDGLPTN